MISWFALLALVPLVPSLPHERSDTTVCGQYDTVPADPYSLSTNLWGKAHTSSGSQCAAIQSVYQNTVQWSTWWSWAGDSTVKSFANIQLNSGINRQLSAISSIPSVWKWSQSNDASGTVANVAYDLFTSYTAGGSKVNEVMIWVANYNAGPISYEYNAEGQAIPTAGNLHIAGHRWNLYSGTNGYNAVYSFLPVSGNIQSFDADIYKFFTYLIKKGHVDSSQYLTILQAGTEATYGAATFDTSAYSVTIN